MYVSHKIEDDKIIVSARTNKLIKQQIVIGVQKITFGLEEAYEYLRQILEIQKEELEVLDQSETIGNYANYPVSGNWIFTKKQSKLVEEEECGQTKLTQKISGNLKRSLKKEE